MVGTASQGHVFLHAGRSSATQHGCAHNLPMSAGRPLAVCTLVRNECNQLFNWVEFHRYVGVTNFTLYLIDEQDCSRDVLQGLVDLGVVKLLRWPADGFTSRASVQPTIHGYRRGDLRFTAHLKRAKSQSASLLEMLSLCAGQVQLTASNDFNLTGTPFNWEFCQVAALADCMSRHSDFRGWLGLFDVDEFMLPAPPQRTLQQALRVAVPSGSTVDQVAVQGMIYGSSHMYPPLLPTDVVPLVYHSHSTTEWNAEDLRYRKVGDSDVRAYAVKSFYWMPQLWRNWGHKGIPIEVHSARTRKAMNGPTEQVVMIPREGGAIRYNHYMYRSTQELALAGLLISNPEKRPTADLMDVFNAIEHDTRMDHLLPDYLAHWSKCLVPVLLERLQAYAQRRLTPSKDPIRHALNASERKALRSYKTSLMTPPPPSPPPPPPPTPPLTLFQSIVNHLSLRKVDLLKGAEGLTGHQLASLSHGRAARTDEVRRSARLFFAV